MSDLPQIKHPDTLTPENKLDDVLYAHDHEIVGKWPYSEIDIGDGIPYDDISDPPVTPDFSAYPGGTILIPVLISSHDYTDWATSHVVSNINGDDDKEYLIKFTGQLNSATTDKMRCKINNITSYTSQQGVQYPTGAVSQNNVALIVGGFDWNNLGRYINFHGILKAKTGHPRVCYIQIAEINSGLDGSHAGAGGWVWRETSTNITSLTFERESGGSFKGLIEVYKLVSISL